MGSISTFLNTYNYFDHKSLSVKRIIKGFTLILFLLSTSLSFGEGSKELWINNHQTGFLLCNNFLTHCNGPGGSGDRIQFAVYECDSLERLYFDINSTNEVVYFGMDAPGGWSTHVRYRIKSSDGTIVYAETTAPQSGPGFINDISNARVGPEQVYGSGGYEAIEWTPPSVGTYYIEFQLFNDGFPGGVSLNTFGIELFDLTVYNVSTSTVQPGRLYSYAWQFDSYQGVNRCSAKYFIYSTDSIITSLELNTMQGGYWFLYCNQYGVENTGNFEVDRKSVNYQAYGPQYRIFLNEPDPVLYPPATVLGSITDTVTATKYCHNGSIEFNVTVDKPGNVEIEMDFDAPYVTRTVPKVVEGGVNVVLWDGLDGAGNPVPNNTNIEFTVSYINGLTNLPLYDVEGNQNGWVIELVSPAGSTPLVFWDDSNVSGSTELNGCTAVASPWSGCHSWNPNWGDYKTVNTWWYTASESTLPVVILEERGPDSLVFDQPTQNYCAGTQNIPISVATDPNTEIYHWFFTGTDVTINQADPTDNFITIDLGPLATTGFISVYGENASCGFGDTSQLYIGIQNLPIADAGPDDTICINQTITLSGDSLFASSIEWNTLGDGSFSSGNILTPVYTPGSGDIAAMEVQLVLSATAVAPCADPVTDTMLLTFHPLPEAIAGNDTAVCENQTITLDGIITNSNTCTWTSSGDGSFDDASLTNATYTPGPTDITNGTVTLTLTANAFTPCTLSDNDALVLSVDPLPEADAGPDETICINQTVSLSGITANSNSSIWTTLGDGVFDDASDPSTTYTPGTNDLITGTFQLVFTAEAITPCVDNDHDTLVVTVNDLPVSDAGVDSTICINNDIILYGTISNSGGSTWQTLGNGTFSDPTSLSATYSPGTNDQAAGFVELVLTADPIPPCTDPVNDTMVLSFDPLPVSFAGNDTTICVNQSVTFTGTSTYASSVQWTTVGDGSFDDQSALTSTYTPGTADLSNGSVEIVLTAFATFPCTDPDSDTLILSFDPLPIANPGTNQTICLNTTATMSGSLTNSINGVWSTSGDGNFDDPASMSAIYTPGNNDKINGSVVLTLTADPLLPCTDSHDSTITITLIALPEPQIAFQPNDTVCINSVTNFLGTDNSGLNIVTWGWNLGDGSTASGQNVNYTYTSPNINNVMLYTIDNNGCTDTTYSSITVTDPVIGFNFADNPVCFEDTVSLIGNGDVVNYTEWLWDFGDGNTGTGRDTIHVYDTPGDYNVSLTVCSKTATDIAEVIPQAVSNAGSNHTICLDNPFDFNTSTILPDTTSADSVLWFGGTGYFSDPKLLRPVYYNGPNELGIIPLSMIAYGIGPCSNDTSIMYLTIDSVPDGSFIYSPIDTSCVNQDVVFTGSSSTVITNWNWDFGDGFTGSGENVNHTYVTGEETFYINLSITNQFGCSTTLSDSIFIDSVNTDFTMPSFVMCFGDTAVFNGIGDDITHTDWEWDFGDGQTAIGKNTQHIYSAPGVYEVTMNTCTDTTRHMVTINTLPESSFTVSPNDTSCVGELVTFDATNITSDIVDWQWQFGDGQTGTGQTPTHTYTQQGDMTILSIYTNGNGCIDTTAVTRYAMNVNIDFDIYQSPSCQDFNVSFTGTGDRVTFTPWDWQFGDGATSTGIDVNHTYTIPDTVDITLDVCSEQMTHQLIINAACEVYAGSNGITCQDVYYDFSESTDPPTADDFSYLYWYTDGLGYFDDPTLLAPTYFPDPSEGASVNDTITMMLVGYGIAPCENDTSWFDLVVIPGAYAQAGSDENTCQGVPYDFHNSTDSSFATNYITLYWTTNGTGYFVNPNVEHPIYVPGPSEVGPVTLTMVASNIIACDSIDEMILTIRPTYEMPHDITICHYDSIFAQGAWRYNSGTFYDTLYTAQYGCDSVIVTNLTVRPKIDQDFFVSSGDSTCYGESISFSATGSASLTDWFWEFGDGYTSNDMDPVHQYDTSGIFNVIYHYTDINGCSDSATHQVLVFDNPDADFTMNMANACVDTEISFNGLSNSTIISWEWDFDDGSTGSGQNVSHVFTTWGIMDVALTVVDINGCSFTTIQEVIIAQPPVADFTYTPAICDSIQFTDLSTCSPGYNLVEWYWDFGDGTTDTLQNPSHRYPSNNLPGGEVFMVNLIVSADSLGFICTDSITLPVTVPSLPDIFQYIDPSPTCFGDTTYFSGHSGFPIETWHWDFGDGNFSNDSVTSHLYATADTFNVTLNIIDTNQCTNSATEVLIVKPAPAVSFTMSDSVICKGGPVYFNATGSANVDEWYWEFGDGGISYLQNPVHYYPSGNTYTVTLTVTDSTGCSSTASDVIMVLPGPTADFSYANQSCTAVAFFDDSDIPTGYFATEFFWDFGDGFTSDLQNPVHSYTTGISTYDVMFVVTADSSGYSCSDTTYQTIYTPGLPSVFFTWDPEPTMLGNTTNFYGNSGNTITDWNWDFHDGTTSTDQNPAHVFPTVGTFNVELTVTDIEGCENTVTHLVTVVNIPDLDYEWSYACLGEQIQFTILDPPTDIGAVTSWDWDFGDGSTSDDMEPIHTYAASGTYNVSCSIVDTMGATNTVIKQLTVNPLPNSLFNIGTQVCANNPVEFFDHSTTQTGYITEWFWEFGDGSDTTVYFGGDPDVTHIYSGTSTYTVTLTVTNSDSCSNSSTHTVTTEPGPIALFDYNSGCASGPVSFTDESTINGGGEIVTWLWDFGDPGSGASNTSTLQNPVHLFSAPGDYTVLLMVANINGCEDTVSHTVTVSEEPEVDFTWEANCLTEETQFTVDESVTNVGEVATWSWSFGDGGTSNLQNPTHTYEVAGTFDVILSIETTDGCFASVTHSVDINPLPTANFAHTGPSCLNDTVYFSNLSSSPNGLIETWVWDFGDGNEITINAPDNPNVEHMYTNEGTFDVVLTVTDAEGCENNVTKQVVIVSSPIADFNWEAGCLNEPVQFTDISSTNGGPDIGEWEWYFGDPASGTNNTSNLPNPTHVFSTDSTFTVTLIIHNTMGCTDTVEHEIVITPLPDVDFTIESDTICLGSLAQFTGISNSEIATWYWQFGDGGTSIEQNPGYGYQQAGTYTVTLTVTDVSGCENSTSQEVHVNYAPEALFSYDNACLGDSTSFTDLSFTNIGYINNWSWDFGDGNTSTDPDPVHTYTTNDTYYVTLVVWDNSGCSDSITLPVQVFDVPVPAFNFAQACDPPGQVNFFNESVMGSDNSPITGYEWHLDDGYYSDEVDPSYIYEITDTCYQVTLTAFNNNGCSATDTMEVCVFGAIETSFEATDVCLGQPTEFQAFYGPENDSVASYLWNFHDGSQTELTYHDTISHIFPAPGIYVVELIATDTNDCQAVYTSEITIDSLPVASFTNTIGGCEIPTYFEGVTYSGGEFIESWYWDFGDTTSTNNTDSIWNPTHLYGPNDSTYLVQLIVTNYNGCIDTVVQEVYVAPCITAGFKIPDEPVCARNELFFVDTSFLASNNGMIGTWLWDFGDGTTETYDVFTDTVWHTYADAGTYELSLTITAGIDTNSYTTTTMVEFEVHPTPLPMIGLDNNCQRDTTYFSDNSTIFDEPTTYRLWNFGDPTTEADTSNVQDPKYVYPTFEDYPVSLFVQNRFMCADSTKDTITIYKLPEAQFTYQNTCMSYYTQFEETSIADSAVIAGWFWNFGDTLKAPADTAIIQAPQYIYDSAGMYTVEMIITDEHLCMDTATTTVEIMPKPISEFVMIDTNRQGQVYFDNLSTNNPVDYEWDFDYNQGIWTSNDINPIFQYEEDGNYTVMLVSWNQQGCPDTTYQVYDLLFTNLFVPNTFVPSSPITDLQTFKPVGINLSSYKLEVYSAWGNLVFETTELIDGVPSEGWDGTYEGEPLPTGSYIWRIEAVFEDGSHWRGTDNGDGNTGTSGTIMLVR